MHQEAHNFIGQFASTEPLFVIEIGSRNINGTARDHFPKAHWIGLDIYPGPCVDVVCNARHYKPHRAVDLVVCCEVLEHTDEWRSLIHLAMSWLKPQGHLLATCAGPNREPHSAYDGGPLQHEFYRNLSPDDIQHLLPELPPCTLDTLVCTGYDLYFRIQKL